MEMVWDLEKEYTQKAFEAIAPHLEALPADVQRAIRLAVSVRQLHGSATSEEMAAQLGTPWVIARRTPRIIQRYGADVVCITRKQYHAAERRAIEARLPA